MGGTLAIYYAVAVVLLIASSFLLKPRAQKSKQDQDFPTTLTRRGSVIPYVIGRREVGPGFGWADDEGRFSRTEKGSGGGKGFGSGGAGKQTIWYSAGWHILCPGPADSLEYISENGKEVWRGPITRETTPSGSVIDAGDVGIFEIYWGELDQPISPTLQSRMRIGSRWPGVCHIVWVEKRLGTATTWPQLEYGISCEFLSAGSLPVPYMVDDGIARGVNPACALYQLLTGSEGYGIGLDPDYVDELSLLEVADVCQQENLAANLLISDGENSERPIQGILGDIGAMMFEHEGRLCFKMIRDPSGFIASFNDDIVEAPDLEQDILSSDRGHSKVVYSFSDELYNYRDNDVKIDNDASAGSARSYRSISQDLYIPTHKSVAARIASRRVQEPFGGASSFKVRAMRAAGMLNPGDVFLMPGVGNLRVLSVLRDTFSASSTLGCFLDSYGIASDYEFSDGETDFAPLPAEDDLAVAWVDIPPSISGVDSKRISALRVRAHGGISGAKIWASADGGAYELLGVQAAAAAGGPLLGSLSSSTPSTVESGPLFESLNQDSGAIRNLSADEAAWQAGSQLALLGDEILFLREVELQAVDEWEPSSSYGVGDEVIPTSAYAYTGWRYVCVSGGSSGPLQPLWPTTRLGQVSDGDCVWEARGYVYRAKGLIRARAGSTQAAHPAGTTLFVISESVLSSFGSAILQDGSTICLKTQPYTVREETSLGATSPICRLLDAPSAENVFLTASNGSVLKSAEGNTLIIGA